MKAGHGGASGRYDYLKEIAFDYAFLLRELGLYKLIPTAAANFAGAVEASRDLCAHKPRPGLRDVRRLFRRRRGCSRE